MSIIFINVITFILSTEPYLYDNASTLFITIEATSVTIFTIEYLLRLWCSAEKSNYRHRKEWLGRVRFVFSLMSLIDLVSIVPFYIAFFVTTKFAFSPVFRIFRIFRMFKAEKYSKAFSTIGKVIMVQKGVLGAAVILSIVLLVVQATLLWAVEHNDFPERYGSIPRTLWYSVLMITGMGGYEVPMNVWGKLIAAVTAVLAVALFALPVGILSNGFITERAGSQEVTCPNCEHQFVH